MEEKPFPHAPQPYPSQPEPFNTMGLVGLLLSIFGFFSLITAPIGLIVSCMGLKHEPKVLGILGIIIGSISTLYAATAAAFMFLYFGTIAMCCCFGGTVAWQAMAQDKAISEALAGELNRPAEQISIRQAERSPPMSDDMTVDGTAVYTDDDGTRTGVDFHCQVIKVDGAWEVHDLTITSEPYEWIEPEIDSEPDSDF
ncbi:MAG: hypothetical protein KDA41_16060 [Planctomycetales bacterium]|nr:hypothetical protein [Planctomycetales bacterium]